MNDRLKTTPDFIRTAPDNQVIRQFSFLYLISTFFRDLSRLSPTEPEYVKLKEWEMTFLRKDFS